MNSTGIPSSSTELRVFSGGSDTDQGTEISPAIQAQISFLPDLTQQFESVTGWKLSYVENRRSFLERTQNDSNATIEGELEISDLSDSLPVGKSASHRSTCQGLVQTLDEMIRIIQSDRKSLMEADRRLSPVVDVPFDWWALTGKTGSMSGQMATWSITSEQNIRLFAGELMADTDVESSICCSTIIGAFEAASQASVVLHEFAPIIPHLLKSTLQTNARLSWFTSIELDPITGEFQVDGYESSQGMLLIDLHAATVLDWTDSNGEDTLYSGQVLGLGINRQQRQDLAEILTNAEMSTTDFRKLAEKQFGRSASLFLYRK